MAFVRKHNGDGPLKTAGKALTFLEKIVGHIWKDGVNVDPQVSHSAW